MRGKTLALEERATSAGYVFPLAWFKLQGVKDINAYFSDHFFAGSHDAAIDAVLNNKADTGAEKTPFMNECGDYTHGLTRNLLSLQALPVFLPMVFVCVITYLKNTKSS